jgi:hypothetical protein
MQQSGFAHLLLLVLIGLVIIIATVYLLIAKKVINIPQLSSKLTSSQQPAFDIRTEYQNPFRKDTENAGYVNPFENLK